MHTKINMKQNHQHRAKLRLLHTELNSLTITRFTDQWNHHIFKKNTWININKSTSNVMWIICCCILVWVSNEFKNIFAPGSKFFLLRELIYYAFTPEFKNLHTVVNLSRGRTTARDKTRLKEVRSTCIFFLISCKSSRFVNGI